MGTQASNKLGTSSSCNVSRGVLNSDPNRTWTFTTVHSVTLCFFLDFNFQPVLMMVVTLLNTCWQQSVWMRLVFQSSGFSDVHQIFCTACSLLRTWPLAIHFGKCPNGVWCGMILGKKSKFPGKKSRSPGKNIKSRKNTGKSI